MRVESLFCATISIVFGNVYQQSGEYVSASQNPLDVSVYKVLKEQSIAPSKRCTDPVFLRRVCIDLTGLSPNSNITNTFLSSKDPDKRAKLVEQLLQSEQYVDYWTLKWCDVLRVKAEFPVNLWPNGVQAYYKWIHTSISENKPYDQFANELLTSSGSNFRVAPVNFYRAIQGTEPETIASAVALTFMGIRLENWPDSMTKKMTPFFSRLCYKGTKEWKEEIIYNDPVATDDFQATLPDGTIITVRAGDDPREIFAKWLFSVKNRFVASTVVNRIWFWLMGSGIYAELDDVRQTSKPINPELLKYLQDELVKSNWDIKELIKLIVSSQTYQQSSVTDGETEKASKYFGCYTVRRVDAEVLSDMLDEDFGGSGGYDSKIPEPFTFVPSYQRAVQLEDGSITNSFLEMFGRPARDTGFMNERDYKPAEPQSLYMLNSNDIKNKIERSWKLKGLLKRAGKDNRRLINGLYIEILNRYPDSQELETATEYFTTSGLKSNQAANDIAWALVNSKEYLYKH